MLKRRSQLLILATVLLFVACGGQEEASPTTAATATKLAPTATVPEPTTMPTEMPTEIPPTATTEPTATSEPETVEPEVSLSPVGYWEGAISTSGVEIAINLEFSDSDGSLSGTIDIPQQGAVDLALDNVSFDDGQLHFEIAAVGAIFDGQVMAGKISGDFAQGPATGTFEVVAAQMAEEESSETVTALPYRVEEVSWIIGETTVEATMTTPEGEGPFPAIIMVAGSGPTDRDWNSPLLPGNNGSAALFADILTRAGFVTLRYDKRVSGPNALANLEQLMGQVSLESHLEEVAGGVALLAGNEAVDSGRIFGLANSEGAIHALNYQQLSPEWPLAGLILAAPPGRPMLEVLRSQLEPQLATLDDPEGLLALYDEAIERFLAGEGIAPSSDLPAGIQQLLLSLEAPANLPFTRELFTVDSGLWLSEIDAPVLVLIGKKDVQIDWQLDGGRLEEATSGQSKITFVYPENANHVIKYEEKPASELTANDALSYNAADRILDEEAVAQILTWLSSQ